MWRGVKRCEAVPPVWMEIKSPCRHFIWHKKNKISFAPIKQLVGAVSERTGGKSGFYNVPLPIWAFLHFVSTDHLGTLINFGQKGQWWDSIGEFL